MHGAVASVGVRYVSAPPSFEEVGQKIRLPEQVLGERLGTCLDLALLYAALFEHVGLDPFVIVQRGHALVGCWLEPRAVEEPTFGSALELRKAVAAGVAVALEATVACVVAPPIVTVSPSELTPTMSAMPVRLTKVEGAARRCFIVGISV